MPPCSEAIRQVSIAMSLSDWLIGQITTKSLLQITNWNNSIVSKITTKEKSLVLSQSRTMQAPCRSLFKEKTHCPSELLLQEQASTLIYILLSQVYSPLFFPIHKPILTSQPDLPSYLRKVPFAPTINPEPKCLPTRDKTSTRTKKWTRSSKILSSQAKLALA